MWIEKLDLAHWRNHELTRCTFATGTTVFVGPNGQGKTNIVEAIRYLGTLSSHRVSGTAALIQDHSDHATIHAQLRHQDRSVEVGLTIKKKGASEALVNSRKGKVSDIPLWVSVVLFAPEDMAIIRGEPAHRRQFMDELVITSRPHMAARFLEFERVLRQRNSLLKTLRSSSKNSHQSLEVWDDAFAALSAEIIHARLEQLSRLASHVQTAYETLASGDQVTSDYVSSSERSSDDLRKEDMQETARDMREHLARKAPAEIERGMTLVGPHRDDVELRIGGRIARTHASQGEAWSLALALRLATVHMVREESSSGDPIVILDDVFSELDARRRRTLLSLIHDFEQLIITSAVEEDLPEGLDATVWDVQAGVVSRR